MFVLNSISVISFLNNDLTASLSESAQKEREDFKQDARGIELTVHLKQWKKAKGRRDEQRRTLR